MNRICNGFTDEFTVPLQRVESILNSLVNGLLDGSTNFFNLVDTAARLHTATKTHTNEKSVQIREIQEISYAKGKLT